jgi:hypothetical protein
MASSPASFCSGRSKQLWGSIRMGCCLSLKFTFCKYHFVGKNKKPSILDVIESLLRRRLDGEVVDVSSKAQTHESGFAEF